MSPASQGNLEVERYIGSCLISSSVRVNNIGGKSNNSGNHSNGSLLPLCECGGLKFGATRYGSSGPTTGVSGSWTGLPLISMAPSNSRRSPNSNFSKNGILDGDHCSQNSRTPLSRLAIHTQGAPLILAGRYTINGRKNNVSHNRGPPLRQFRGGDLNVRRSNSIRDARDAGGSGISPTGSNSNTPNSDCVSVASDESSGHSENSLPRIIKPRKRRKKDRKPPLTATSACDTSTTSVSSDLKNPAIESPRIVTLKPYVPLCYELYDNGQWIGNRLSFTKQNSEGNIKTSEDDNQEPKLHHKFEDVEEDEEGLHVDSGALFPYPCPPSLCQCRYCDPSGLIWDVDQHCYSPFLTPPSPTMDNKSTSYSKSPFANIPLFLTPPPTDVRGFDFFNKDLRSTSTPLVFLPENDHSSVLRRSWSEPLPSSSFCRTEESHGSFGTIGHGRVCDDNVTESRHVRRSDDRNVSVEVPANTVSVAASQSLEVSTEIVTSPNGHRDIEIKFYSSSPPVGATMISTRDIKYSYDPSVCDESSVRNTRTSLPTSLEEDVIPQEAVNVKENMQHENGESSENVQSGNVEDHTSVNCEQDSAPCDCTDNLRPGDRETCGEKARCNMSDYGSCEQSAKTLGEEVDQLHLHAEE
ncbi:hypothetical protein B7P43_G00694 [Cryptotermes secundus]|uniref:Uncharacterized protein n=1 Tax=Cryptotermes secundus TaxID=105785 RepID=A0A2J7RS23_9NEOP|nr:hypothetical protein B7P43_G00694 [Cryptotermes secundus]